MTAQRWTTPLAVVFVLWIVQLFEPQLWLAGHGAGLLLSAPSLLFGGLALIVVASRSRRVWFFPFLLLIAGGAIMVPYAGNGGIAFDLVVKLLLFFYILAIGSMMFVASIDKTVLLLHLFFWQFLWWSLNGVWHGRVSWHFALGNEDAFGALMVIGAAYCFYFGQATRQRSRRVTAFVVAGFCVAGVVSSFARGAFLALALVAAFAWLRSPHKGRTLAGLILGTAIILITADLFFPNGLFWQEMSTISDGFEDSTGLDRWVLWKTAWRAFLERPLFGVGAGNFGVFAGANLWTDPQLADFYRHPGRLWGRVPHSVYFQLIAEFGIVGVIAFTAMLVDFWKRNAQLRSAPFMTAWELTTRGQTDLRMLALGLKASMVAYLITGVFYDQVYIHWFFSLIAINAVLHRNVRRAALRELDVRPDANIGWASARAR